jgi:hypothetical protein
MPSSPPTNGEVQFFQDIVTFIAELAKSKLYCMSKCDPPSSLLEPRLTLGGTEYKNIKTPVTYFMLHMAMEGRF